LDIECARRGFDGPITLALENPAAGFELLNAVIPAAAKTHRLLLVVPPAAQAADLHAVRVVGSAEHQGLALTSVVSTAALVRARTPLISYPPGWVDGLLTVATAPEAPAFFETKLGGDQLAFAADKGEAVLTVTLERTDKEFKDPITVTLEGLAAPFSYAVKQDKDNYTVTIQGPKDAAAQSQTFRVVAYGVLKGQGQVVIKDAVLEVAAPAGS